MATNTTREARHISDNVEVKTVGPDLYESCRLWQPEHAAGVFGGQIMGQAAAAACQTVEEEYSLHSFHTLFLSGASVAAPIQYKVSRLRNGRSCRCWFPTDREGELIDSLSSDCSRTVEASQSGIAIAFATVSFHKSEPSQLSSHHYPANEAIPSPQECPFTPGNTDLALGFGLGTSDNGHWSMDMRDAALPVASPDLQATWMRCRDSSNDARSWMNEVRNFNFIPARRFLLIEPSSAS